MWSGDKKISKEFKIRVRVKPFIKLVAGPGVVLKLEHLLKGEQSIKLDYDYKIGKYEVTYA